MRRLVLIIAAVGMLTFVSCGKDSPLVDEKGSTRANLNDSSEHNGLQVDTTWADSVVVEF